MKYGIPCCHQFSSDLLRALDASRPRKRGTLVKDKKTEHLDSSRRHMGSINLPHQRPDYLPWRKLKGKGWEEMKVLKRQAFRVVIAAMILYRGGGGLLVYLSHRRYQKSASFQLHCPRIVLSLRYLIRRRGQEKPRGLSKWQARLRVCIVCSWWYCLKYKELCFCSEAFCKPTRCFTNLRVVFSRVAALQLQPCPVIDAYQYGQVGKVGLLGETTI
jgi:hypothetical protein